MMDVDKKCVFILPYFGKFNNYFELFLRSCGRNPMFDWLIFTDDYNRYNYPPNVKVVQTTLANIKELAEKKLEMTVSLETPYKLCDFKPAYGLIFEDMIRDYQYWGHCDCDLIFGNLRKILLPLLDEGYDKLFAAGHLTLYKNNHYNNRRFMRKYKGDLIYRNIFSSEKIGWFDEDMYDNNVHSIFLEDEARVYSQDLCMNAAISSAKYVRAYYDFSKREFVKMPYVKARYFWSNGEMFSLDLKDNIVKQEYLYMHFQMRKMRMEEKVLEADVIQILPDRFVCVKKIPDSYNEMRGYAIGFPYLYWIDEYKKKFRRRIRKTLGK